MVRGTRVMAIILPLCLLAGSEPARAVVTLEFDAAYMVAEPGSTVPVTRFDPSGPAPWLYLDLPDAALSSFLIGISSDWFHSSATTKQFSLSNSSFSQLDKYWFSPSSDVWNSKKAAGEWHVNAQHSLIELIIIYGAGVGRVWASGSETISFTVGSGIPGDFNEDHKIDAADYVTWRKGMVSSEEAGAGQGSSVSALTSADYGLWRKHFGTVGGSSLTDNAHSTVPEPLTPALLFTVSLWLFRCRRLS
jgi:hypothetical protein